MGLALLKRPRGFATPVYNDVEQRTLQPLGMRISDAHLSTRGRALLCRACMSRASSAGCSRLLSL
jgi:hypothetical protein